MNTPLGGAGKMLRFVALAGKGLRRRPVRASLTIAGVALAVAVAVSLAGFNLGYRRAINDSIDKLGYQFMIMSKGCPYEAATMMLKGGTGLLYLPANVYDRVRNDPEIRTITPVFVGIAEKEASGIRDDEGGKSFSILSGIDLDSFRAMKPWLAIKQGAGYEGARWFDPARDDEIVLGYEIAEFEQRRIGDSFYATITPVGAVEPVRHEFKVAGILERSGTQDDGTVFLPLGAAQRLFKREGQLTIIGIQLKNFSGASLHDFEQRWLALPEVQVVSLQQVKTTLIKLIDTAQVMVSAVAVIAILVAVIGVVNTILMSVYERTGEIGIMKAVGASRSDIFQLVWYETLCVCGSGAVLGCAVAFLGASVVEGVLKSLLNIGVHGSLLDITPELILTALGGAIVLGFFAGLYPAWHAASLRPVEAIRTGE